MEVVSDDPKDQQRDYEQKVTDYAEANIAEYWIVDPARRVVIVHQLNEGRYGIHGEFTADTPATSILLPGFSVDVAALFAVMDEIPE
jgi:Uma2 family endonuclease